VIAIPFAAGCAAPAPAPAPAPAEVELESFTIKYPIGGAYTTEMGQRAHRPWVEFVERITDGRVKVEVYPDSTLCTLRDNYTAIESGVADFGLVWNAHWPGLFPLLDIIPLPGLFANQATSDFVINDLYDKYPQFAGQYSDKVVNCWVGVHMRSDLHSVEPMRTLEDLQGKVIACTTDAGAKAMNTLGASGTVMTGADAYLAAERGVVDGIFSAWGWVEVFHLDEVTPYHTLIGLSPGSSSWIFNKKTWDKCFTPVEQARLRDFRYEGQAGKTRGNVYGSWKVKATVPKENFIVWSAEGMDKLRELFSPSWEEWAEEMEALGYPGHDILEDAINMLDNYSQS